MRNKQIFDRTVALLNELVDAYLPVETAPSFPPGKRTTGKDRRLYRRAADRLRRGEQEPVFKNLYTPDRLATLLDDIALHDDLRDKTLAATTHFGLEIGPLMREDAEAVREGFDAVFLDTYRLAEEQGPDSEAAARWRTLQGFNRSADVVMEDRRRGIKNPPSRYPLRGILLVPAEVLEEAPEGVTIVPIPAEHDDTEGERLLVRIGLGAASWVGSFACGDVPWSTMFIMPNGEHFFVSACGAGYIIDLESRTLVERTGNDVVGVHRDPLMTCFLIEHRDSLEAFGVVNRLWKTPSLGAGGLRNIGLMEDCVVGEARQASGEWLVFAVTVATGAVVFGTSEAAVDESRAV
jgi:hypothetical protein